MTTRRTTNFVTNLLKIAGLDWPGPDFRAICRRRKMLVVQPLYWGSGGPLNLLANSTGISKVQD